MTRLRAIGYGVPMLIPDLDRRGGHTAPDTATRPMGDMK